MEAAAITERLDSQSATLARIESHLSTLNGRVGTMEKWQAAADPVLDSLNERVDINTTKQEEHQSYIDQQKGGTLVRLQLLSGLVTIFGIIAIVLKMLLWHT